MFYIYININITFLLTLYYLRNFKLSVSVSVKRLFLCGSDEEANQTDVGDERANL